jgi:hypothetical protein
MQQRLSPQQVIDHDPEGIEMVNSCLEGRQGHWRGPCDVLIAIAAGEIAIIGYDDLGIQCFGVKNAFGALQNKLGSRQTSSPYVATGKTCASSTTDAGTMNGAKNFVMA